MKPPHISQQHGCGVKSEEVDSVPMSNKFGHLRKKQGASLKDEPEFKTTSLYDIHHRSQRCQKLFQVIEPGKPNESLRILNTG